MLDVTTRRERNIAYADVLKEFMNGYCMFI